jgi:hypothetical protein
MHILTAASFSRKGEISPGMTSPSRSGIGTEVIAKNIVGNCADEL